MTYRDYDPDKDLTAVQRIWKEVGWINDIETDGIYVDTFFRAANDALVATIDGEAECAVHGMHGEMMYQDQPLALGAVTGVTTSRISRKLGFARELTARLIARQAEAGMDVSALGMFEQGFYDQLGFGTGVYEQWIRFDPATLVVDRNFRPPRRLQQRDFRQMHESLWHRAKTHGAVSLNAVEFAQAETGMTEEPFGLGYFDGPNGSLSHFIWGTAKGENGPYIITLRAWQTPDQLLELLALIKSLGDQVSQVSMLEIGDIQLQDLLKHPMRTRRATRNSQFANESRSLAYWQMRILDLASCMTKTHLNTPALRFNLILHDPVQEFLDDGHNWRGISGKYIVQLGEESRAEQGEDGALPTLEASVNAFSRMWFGIRPASSLAITDRLAAEPALLQALDRTVRLPRPHLGLDF